ncbi:hypothetical protein AAG570_000415 [Ranatra chinensis]|uniref:Uncharacterized protein n=1 Tax=Ranatra chinensis TaxID=642074 RepID=A0ABD0ZI65_9HEMI
MASNRQNIFYQSRKQETTEIEFSVNKFKLFHCILENHPNPLANAVILYPSIKLSSQIKETLAPWPALPWITTGQEVSPMGGLFHHKPCIGNAIWNHSASKPQSIEDGTENLRPRSLDWGNMSLMPINTGSSYNLFHSFRGYDLVTSKLQLYNNSEVEYVFWAFLIVGSSILLIH